jgi:MFS transporter, SP family, xylose:H+ symportor
MNSASSGGPVSSSPGKYNMAYVWAISLVAAMGGLLFGYDWVVIGGAKPFFEKFFDLKSAELSGWANSCALLGCLVGSLFTGGISDKFGRKRLLIFSAILFAASSVLTGWASTFRLFVLWRMLGGVAIGMASNLSPMYIAEVAPPAWRGRLVAMNQMTIVIGILAAQFANLLIAEKVPPGATDEFIRASWNGTQGWRWMFTAVAAPSLLFFVCSLLVPESPRWLVKNGRGADARRVLARIGGEAHADAELREIQTTIGSAEVGTLRLRDLLEPRLAKILLVGCVLAVLQQWSGINVLFNYAEEIFKSAGFDYNDIMINIVLTGAINMVFTLVAIFLVDRAGRRVLMLIGCLGIGIFHTLLGMAFALKLQGMVVLVITLCTLGCYALSLAPITWVLISEIFPNRIRGTAVSVAVSALWIACFVLTYTFPMLNHSLGAAKTFWLYAGICIAGFFFVLRQVPETKGKTLEQIEKELGE